MWLRLLSKSFNVASGIRMQAIAKSASMVLGGKGYIALIVFALAVAACSDGGSSSAARTKAWEAGPGGRELAQVTRYLSSTNNAFIAGNMTVAKGAARFLRGSALDARNHPPPVDGGAYRQVMTDLSSYGEALMLAKPSTPIQSIYAPVDKARPILNRYRQSDSWAIQLDEAMIVKPIFARSRARSPGPIMDKPNPT